MHSVARSGEIMSNKEPFSRRRGPVGEESGLAYARPYSASNACPSVKLVSHCGLSFPFPSLPVCLPSSLPPLTGLDATEESEMGQL